MLVILVVIFISFSVWRCTPVAADAHPIGHVIQGIDHEALALTLCRSLCSISHQYLSNKLTCSLRMHCRWNQLQLPDAKVWKKGFVIVSACGCQLHQVSLQVSGLQFCPGSALLHVCITSMFWFLCPLFVA
jgi:hypothetical protein